VVGYFTAAGTMTAAGVIAPKDGSGTGAGSWIGYTAGGNVASGSGSAVAAGKFNAATATNASIFAGQSNEAGGLSSLVIGGFDNHALGIDTLVGAGAGNRAVGTRSVVVGGGYNLATGNWSFIGGGGRDGTAATTAGSDPKDNIASGNFSVVTGGQGNRATGTQSVVSGGANNLASGLQSAIPGGLGNTASNNGTVAMGRNATAASFGSFVFSDGTVYSDNGNYTFNVQALGGMYLSPSTDLDFGSQTRQMIRLWGGPDKYGIGVQGSTQYFRVDTGGGNGSGFAWYQGGTHSDTAFDPGTGGVRLMTLSRDGQLALPTTTQQAITLSSSAKGIGGQSFTTYVRVPSTGGMGIYESGTHNNNEADAGGGGILAGIFRTGSGSLFQTATVTGTLRVVNVVATSDRESKTSFAAVAPKEILAKVASMPITTWVYKNEGANAPRHIGPVAQDFAAFGVGQDDKTISTVDASGVALAAIKGLHEELQERDAKIAAQASQIKALERTVSELVATQEDVKVMKAALAELLRERAELGVPVRLTGSGATLIAH
jgi:hypothetical protein